MTAGKRVVCVLKDIDLAKMGECVLKSHAKGAKHVQLLTMRHSDPGVLHIRDILVSSGPSASSTNDDEPVIASVSTVQQQSSANDKHDESSSQLRSASCIASTSEVLGSELLWAIRAICHISHLGLVVKSIQSNPIQ